MLKEKLRSNLSVDEKIIKLNQIRKQKKTKDRIQIIYNIIRKLPEFNNLISDPKLIKVIKLLNGINEQSGAPYLWEVSLGLTHLLTMITN